MGKNTQTLFWALACWSLKCPYANMCSMGNKQEKLDICVELQGYVLQLVGVLLGSQGCDGVTRVSGGLQCRDTCSLGATSHTDTHTQMTCRHHSLSICLDHHDQWFHTQGWLPAPAYSQAEPLQPGNTQNF